MRCLDPLRVRRFTVAGLWDGFPTLAAATAGLSRCFGWKDHNTRLAHPLLRYFARFLLKAWEQTATIFSGGI